MLWRTFSDGDKDDNNEQETPAAAETAASRGFACMAHSIELAKSVSYRVWADAPLASLRQLPDLGRDYVSQLAGAGIVSLRELEKAGPRRVEQVGVYFFYWWHLVAVFDV